MSKFSEAAGKAGKLFNVIGALRAAGTLHEDIPLAYCLMRDSRTPLRSKAWFGAKITAISASIPLEQPLPVVGQLLGEADILMLVQQFRAFVSAVEKRDPHLVAEHRQALANGTSIWHDDVARSIDTGRAFGASVGEAAGAVGGGIRRVGVASRETGRDLAGKVGDTGRDVAGRVGDAGRKVGDAGRDTLRRITGRGGPERGRGLA